MIGVIFVHWLLSQFDIVDAEEFCEVLLISHPTLLLQIIHCIDVCVIPSENIQVHLLVNTEEMVEILPLDIF